MTQAEYDRNKPLGYGKVLRGELRLASTIDEFAIAECGYVSCDVEGESISSGLLGSSSFDEFKVGGITAIHLARPSNVENLWVEGAFTSNRETKALRHMKRDGYEIPDDYRRYHTYLTRGHFLKWADVEKALRMRYPDVPIDVTEFEYIPSVRRPAIALEWMEGTNVSHAVTPPRVFWTTEYNSWKRCFEVRPGTTATIRVHGCCGTARYRVWETPFAADDWDNSFLDLARKRFKITKEPTKEPCKICKKGVDRYA